MSEPRVTVSILTYTALRQARTCIASVLRSTTPFKLILTANGNPDAAKFFNELATEHSFITVVVNEKNEGFIPPNIHAFALCDTEFFVLLNDDTIVPADWLEKLLAPFALYPTGAVCGPRGGCQSLQKTFHGFKGPAFEYLEGSCLMVKTEVLRTHGLFDPHLKFAYGEDSDLSLRMRELGYTLHHADFQLQHEVSATSRYVNDVRKWQGENHAYLLKRWAHYLQVRTFGYPIIVRRGAANGDVLLTTPIVRAIHARSPLSEIFIETLTPQIYANHPYVKTLGRRAPAMANACIYELNGSYEAKPGRHIIESYAERVGLEPGEYTYDTELFLFDSERSRAASLIPDGEKWVAIHPGPNTWRSKEWPLMRFQIVAAELRAKGFKVVLLGAGGLALENDLDQRGRTSVQEMASIIERCVLFIGLDSLPLHVAECMNTKAIGLFGVTDPQFIITKPYSTVGVCGTTPSFGMRHRVNGQTSVDDGGAAMESITIQMVMDAIAKQLPDFTK